MIWFLLLIPFLLPHFKISIIFKKDDRNQDRTGNLTVIKHMQSNSYICVHEYIYATEGIPSVQSVHIFGKLFKFYLFILETSCAQVERQGYHLHSEQIQMMSIIFQKEKKRSVSTLRQEWINFYLNPVYRKAFPLL